MDSFTEAVANLLRIHKAAFHVCRSQFKSFNPFHRFAPFKSFQTLSLTGNFRVSRFLDHSEAEI
jgi:hypothetical protein